MYNVLCMYLIIKTYDTNNSLYNEKQSIHGAVHIIMSPIYSYAYQFTIHAVCIHYNIFNMLLICGTWYILFMKQCLAPVSALRSEDVWQNYFYTYIRYWLIAMPVIYIKSALCFMK